MSFSEISSAALTKPTAAGLPGRSASLKWLRKVHGWLGLWGAIFGLLFGITGILQNHRAVLKIPTPRPQESIVQLSVPDPAPQNAEAMAIWLQRSLKLEGKSYRIKSEKAHPVAWGDKKVQQPAHWTTRFNSPRINVEADYWVGNTFVTVKREDNGLLAMLSNLHKGNGVGTGWILLADSFAGSIIMLSLTGVAMWILTHRGRKRGLIIAALSLTAAIIFALQSL